MREIKKKNQRVAELIKTLSKKKERIWKDVASRLLKSRRNQSIVNIATINRHANNGDIILVPGKVLGYGELNKKITVGALSFSKEAKRKIMNMKGVCLKIEELLEKNPKGSKIRIFG
ncbi:MAG: 50S ribosomal protein L18e [Candidatus Aenigmarchaeota archaeon]|nr:50S ribosomal protein L18e [Candidatus Aenigmarchaeota archaeon]